MHALRCARRCASALPKPSSGIHRVLPSTSLTAAGQPLQTKCRRSYSSEAEKPTDGAASVDERGTPLTELGKQNMDKIEQYYVLSWQKDMTPSDEMMDESLTRLNQQKVQEQGLEGPPKLRFTDIKTGLKYHAGRAVVGNEAAKNLYSEFEPHTRIVKPGPTDLPGTPTQVRILARGKTSPPERVLNSIRRLCFNPSYIVTKEFSPHAIKSTDLLNVELGYGSHYLPNELKPMVMVYKNWRISKGGKAIEKIFRFDNRDTAREFAIGLNRIIKIKITKNRLVDHHPAYGVYGRRVFVRWGTEQPEEGISSWDIACAKQTDKWAGACNVKDLLPEILEWKFETKFVDKSKPTHRIITPEDPETDASDNLMNIIEGLMSATKDLMQAAEDPSKTKKALLAAEASLADTMEKIAREKEMDRQLQEAKDEEVMKWLDTKEEEAQAETEAETEVEIESVLEEAIVEDAIEAAETESEETDAVVAETAAKETAETDAAQSEALAAEAAETKVEEAETEAESQAKEDVDGGEKPTDERSS